MAQGKDGSTSAPTSGTAITLFNGIVPDNGYFIHNPDATHDLWVAEGSVAVANGAGSFKIPALGSYTTPDRKKPVGKISVLPSVNAHAITAHYW